jgi:two-component system LytT family response regulator
MPKINGFEMLELIEQPPAVIFSTAFDEYAIKAFETHAIDYLLKPFSEERFKKAIDKFLEKASPVKEDNTNTLLESMAASPNQAERIVVKTGNKVKIIPMHDIHYLEADDDYVKIVTSDGSYLKNRTMQYYEKTLDARFFVRVHRSHIVHVNQITRIDPYQKETHLAVLRDGKQIPVSKTGYSKLKDILGL